MRRVLFVSAHNSVRSQMAEGLLRSVGADHYESLSAGLYPTPVDMFAIDVMREIGIDISRQESKDVRAFLDVPLFAVVTVCDEARECCPKNFSNCKYVHWKFQDPNTITGSRRERMAMFRLLRDEIAGRVELEFGISSVVSGFDDHASLPRAPA